MEDKSKNLLKKPIRRILMTFLIVKVVTIAVAFGLIYHTMKSEAYARHLSVMNISAEKVAKTIRGVEMNAQNVFDEVSNHLDTPEDVIAALESKVNLNRDTRGYFAAFELNYFPQQGTWFEPYIYQPDVTGFEYKQVGSARHNYVKSAWYLRAKRTGKSFWSEPYYYYDGTSMSGHYCSFVKPITDASGHLACVCGADIKFEWLAKELAWVDESNKSNRLQNKFHLFKRHEFYSVILNNSDGVAVASPEGKSLVFNDKKMLKDMMQKKNGVMDLYVDGEACTVFYGPIEYVDWTLAVVVPKLDLWTPLIPIIAVLLVITVIGLLIVRSVCRSVLGKSIQTSNISLCEK